ncbi:ABC transporter permease [Halorarius litoreus]|uniref:ABC transporter permease n=1 Tax=Halorarius litoreus TaxID=2962676 RepID=UPI0020CE5796|nr:PrsW family intramembrane metalloprotease [Halorarius litoreus]
MNPRKILRVARWEVTKGAGSLDRKTLLAAAGILLLVVAMVPTLVGGGVAVDDGLYRVGIDDDHPLYEPVAQDPTFAVREPSATAYDAGHLELLVEGRNLRVRDTEKGRAAVAELRATVERYNDRIMAAEPNQSAAFPVFPVSIEYAERDSVEVVAPGGDGGDGGSGGGAGGDGGTGDGTGGESTVGDETSAGGSAGLPAIGGDIFGTGHATGAPSDLAPPFPLQSLLLAFLFVLPMNFVVQAYGSTLLKERLNRRGELLLVAPLSRGDIIAGKTLPYFLAAVGVACGIAVAVGGGVLSIVGVVPLVLLFLATTFLAAMFARSFKELTFLTVTISVGLTSYAFIPAIFTEVQGVALISPLTLVVRDLTGTAVSAGDVAFTTLPPTLTAVVMFGLGAGLYREEDLFTQRRVPLKLLDALAGRIQSARSLVLVTTLLIPFVFVAELLVVATLFALPGALSIPVILAAVAVIEEVAKSLPVLAGFEHGRFDRTPKAALVAGTFSGVGFFLGEKLTLIVQLVGLPQLQAGSAAFQTGVGAPSPLLAAGLLLAPLALHVVTAGLSSLGATEGKSGWLLGLTTAVLVHFAYNIGVITYVA